MTRTAVLALGLALALGAFSSAQDKGKPPAAKTYEGRPLKAWLDDLKDKDPLVQEEAIEVLASAGKTAAAALPELRRLLKGDNAQVRSRAALAVWSIGGDAKAAVEALSGSLKDASLATRQQALDILARIGPDAAPAVAPVVELLDDDDVTVRANASRAVSAMGKAATPGLLKLLDHKDARTRRNTVNLVLSLGTASATKEALDAVTGRLKDTDLPVRVAAARILYANRKTDKAVIDALTEGVKSPDVALRSGVLSSIQSNTERPRALVPLLEVGLKSPDVGTKVALARILHDIEKKPERVLPIYTDAIKSNDRTHWSAAVYGLGELGPAAKGAVPRLVEMMKVRDYYHYEVRNALTRIGEASIKPLVDLLKDSTGVSGYNSPHDSAVYVLGQLGKPAVKAVLPALDDKNTNVRVRAVQVMAAAGPDAKDAVSKLVEILKDTNQLLRDNAVTALGAIGAEARSAVPDLVKVAQGKDANARAASFRALALIGPDAKDVLEATLDALKENNSTVKLAALELLVRVDPKHKDVVPQLKDQFRLVSSRSTALVLAGRLGDNGEPLVPAILDLLKDPSDFVRRQAVDALGQIGPAVARTTGATAALLEQLKRPDYSLHSSALTALRAVKADAKTAVPALVDYIKSSRTYALSAAIQLLGDYGPAAAPAADGLLALVKDTARTPFDRTSAALALAQVAPDRLKKDALPSVRVLMSADASNYQAARAVLLADPNDKEALALLEAGLKNAQYYARSNALTQIGLLGKSMKKFLPEARALLKDEQPYVRGAAAAAVWRLSGEAKEALPVLTALVKDAANNSARSSGAYYLGELGADALPALPALRELLKDRDTWVRSQAQTAVTRIERAAADARKAETKAPDKKDGPRDATKDEKKD